ncbi:Deoxynucleoside kinase [Giardia muris]|uniref:Deoxynucleoside kinase n=1 Tax=Giardia muris TaxID=5742 RepID=A0A4Z1SVG1_GIAMU|nr:Deoxynucleoside kinase [Giardia muris]|eukprot:TNJ28905.1 Deoxynucleoside kinase [Giardia muris]
MDALRRTISPLFITMSGLIGAGKTTIARELAEELGVPVYYEPVEDNVYLEDFYRDMRAHSFALQVYLLNRRYTQHQQIVWGRQGGVQDRSIYEDSVFARVLMKQGYLTLRDYETYRALFQTMSTYLPHPHFIVHLDVTPEEALVRIKERSRGCEAGIPLDYLKALYEEYNVFLAEISKRIPVLRVRWDKYKTAAELAQEISKALVEHQAVIDVAFDSSMTANIPKVPASLY